MPEHLENPQTQPRRMTLATIRARLNERPERFTLNKHVANFCQGERNEGQIYGNMTFFDDRFAVQSPYPYDVVDLSTITTDDVVLFADADIPFWIPYEITEHTIQFKPCGICRKIGEREIFGIRRNHIASRYQYHKRPMNISMDIIDDFWNALPFEEKATSERELNVRIQVSQHSVWMRRKMCLRNGDRREIKVRKFTGTEAQMIIAPYLEYGHETSHRITTVHMWKFGNILYDMTDNMEIRSSINDTIGANDEFRPIPEPE